MDENWTTEVENQLNLREGQLVQIVRMDEVDGGWWLGVDENGAEGFFPKGFVDVFEFCFAVFMFVD